MTRGEIVSPMPDNVGERGIFRQLADRFDDSFVQDMARIDALTNKVFGSAADAWRKTLRQGMRAEKTLTRAFYVILGFVEYALLFIYYASAFLFSAGAYDLPYDDHHNEENDQRR